MSMLAKSLVTAERFAAFVARPENVDRYFELEQGEIIELAPPKKPYGIVCGNVTRILGNYAVAAQVGYVTANDAGYITRRSPDSVRGPDVAYWIDSDGTAIDIEYTETPPVLAVEVLSPDDRINQVNRKLTEYLNSGVQQVWIIDPATRDIAIHQPGAAPQFLSEADELSGEPTLPGFHCVVAEFFKALATAR